MFLLGQPGQGSQGPVQFVGTNAAAVTRLDEREDVLSLPRLRVQLFHGADEQIQGCPVAVHGELLSFAHPFKSKLHAMKEARKNLVQFHCRARKYFAE
jgi:hypothetical protein